MAVPGQLDQPLYISLSEMIFRSLKYLNKFPAASQMVFWILLK
jgi:hypothetical protein